MLGRKTKTLVFRTGDLVKQRYVIFLLPGGGNAVRLADTMSLSYNYPPQMAYPSAPPVYRALPAPPRLHWGMGAGAVNFDAEHLWNHLDGRARLLGEEGD
jgi:hypothetical protein